MAKNQSKGREKRGKLISWDEAAKLAAENNGNLPDGVRVASPYGSAQVDAGNMEIVGGATGDDGNTGSAGASVARGGARD